MASGYIIAKGFLIMKTVFEVYGRFGRVISRHICDHEKELHHRAAEEARKACANYHGDSWVRQYTKK